MSLFGGLRIAEGAMNVHRLRSEIAAENVANVNTPGYARRVVDLRAGRFATELDAATGGARAAFLPASSRSAARGAVEVGAIRRIPGSEATRRQDAFQSTLDMMKAKSAYELNVKVATMLKSMATASLEIGRGG